VPGYLSSKSLVRIGLGEKSPQQLGQTFSKTSSTHSLQNVHSNVQIIASWESGARSLLQFSQVGLSSSINVEFYLMLSVCH
jgi:hypothetical protein